MIPRSDRRHESTISYAEVSQKGVVIRAVDPSTVFVIEEREISRHRIPRVERAQESVVVGGVHLLIAQGVPI
jgi:hypothetical protein